MALYDKFIALIPKDLNKFVITNGAWTNNSTCMSFLNWCADNNFRIIISQTQEHKAHQDAETIIGLASIEGIQIKEDDEIHPMGRAATFNWKCTLKCMWHEYDIRLGIFPTGHILMQNCDGVYPVVGSIYENTFEDVFKSAVALRTEGCTPGCLNVNMLIANGS